MARFDFIFNNLKKIYKQLLEKKNAFIIFWLLIILFVLADFLGTFIYKSSIYFHFLEAIFFTLILIFIIKYYIFQYEKEKKIAERERLLKEIIESTRETLDVNKIKSNIIHGVGKAFNADICAIRIFDPVKKEFTPLDKCSEYRSSEDIKSLIGYEFKPELIDHFKKKALTDKLLMYSNSFEYIEKENLRGTAFEELIKDIDLKSSCTIYIFYENQHIGSLAVHFTKKFFEFNEDDIDFLKTLSIPLGTAIYQSRLYEKAKKTAEREKLLREIVASTRETLDINKIKSNIVNEVGKAFNADICAIKIMDPENGNFIPMDEYSEYRSSADIKSLIGNEFMPEVVEHIKKEAVKRKGLVVIPDSQKFLEEENLFGTEIEALHKNLGLKSSCITHIFYANQLIGDLAVHYTTRFVKFSQDDIDFLQTLSVQVGAAIYQSRLYEKVKQTAKRETLLREILESTSTTFDIDKIRSNIVNKIGQTFNADLCVIGVFDVTSPGYNLIPLDEHSEYRSSSDIRTIVGYEAIPEVDEYFSKKSKEKIIVYSDISKFLEEENLIGTKLELFLKKDFKFKSSCIVFIFYKGQVIGSLGIHYIKKYADFSQDDIDFFKTLLLPIGSVLYQALLYRKVEQTAKREALLRRLDHAIRSSLDINILKNTIVTEIGKSLNADRCTIVQIDLNTTKFLVVDEYSEYIASPEFRSTVGLDFESEELKSFKESLLYSKRERVAQDIDNFPEYYNSEEVNTLKEYGIKSAYEVPITYGGNVLGALLINYIIEKKSFSEEELDFIRALADQAGIALYQSCLYNTVKQSAEKEKLIRSIIEASRSTLELKEMKHSIVNQIGKTFKADRCNIFEFDIESQEFAMPDAYSEYLSSSIIKSVQVVEPEYKEATNYIFEKFKRKEEVNWISVDDFVKQNHLENTVVETFIRDYEIRSSINVPMFYRNFLVGYLAADFAYECTLDDLKFFRVLASQAGIAIYQAKLYEKEKSAVKRERLLRDIISIISGTLDINKIKQSITEAIGRAFNFDRCFIVEYNADKDVLLSLDEYSEYCSSDDIKRVAGFDFSQDSVSSFKNWGKNKKEIFVASARAFIEENKESFGKGLEYYVEKYDIESAFQLGLHYSNQYLGILVGHSKEILTNYTEEEREFLRTLANQTGIALYQAKLYEKTKQTAERESLLIEVISSIRSTLDIEKILKIICEKVARVFNIERATLTEHPELTDYSVYKIHQEYKTRESIIGVKEILISEEVSTYWGQNLVGEGKAIAIDNIQESNLPDYMKNFYNPIGVKSILGVPIGKNSDKWGFFLLSKLDQYKHWTDEEIELLKAIADQLFITIKQAQLYEKERETAEREKLLRTFIETSRSTLDKEKLKSVVTKKVGQTFGADRCYFATFDKKKNRINPLQYQFISGPDIEKISSLNPYKAAIKYFTEIVASEGAFIVNDTEIFSEKYPNEAEFSQKYFKEYNIKSIFTFPVWNTEEEAAYLIIQYIKNKTELSRERTYLLKTISDQIAIAYTQADLYQKERETAKREKILRKLVETFRSTLDKEKLKEIVMKEVGESLDADRCLLLQYDKISSKFIPPSFQYVTENVKPIFTLEPYNDAILYFCKIMNKQGFLTIADTNKFNEIYPEEPTNTQKYYKDFDIKSDYIFPIWSTDIEAVSLIVQYTKEEKKLSEKDIELLKTIVNQVIIAYTQADLFEREKQTAKREALQRNIIESIRSTINKYKLKSILVKTIGEYFNADRVLFSEFNEANNMYHPVDKHSEYLSSPEEKSFIDYDWSDPSIREYIQPLIEKKELNIFSWDEYKKANPKEQAFIELFEDARVKSSYNIPAIYGNEVMGYFCIEFTRREYKLSIDDLTLVRDICSQSAIGLYQAKLYEAVKQTAERETILREIVSTISSTLDFNKIRKTLVTKLGEAIKSDFNILYIQDPDTNRFITVDEYSVHLSSSEIESPVGINIIEEYSWGDSFRTGEMAEVIYSRVEDFKRKFNICDTLGEQFFDKYKVKSCIAIPVKYANLLLGVLAMNYTKQYKAITEEDVNLVRAAASQAGIALYQARLYENQKKSAKKEKLLREVISDIRGSQSLDEVYNYILKKLTSIFLADRCIFLETSNYKYDNPIIKYEYIRNKILQPLKDQDIPEAYIDKFKEAGESLKPVVVNSLLAMPLVRYNRETKLLGIIALWGSSPREWTLEEIELLKTITDSVVNIVWDITKLTEIEELRNTFVLTLAHDFQVPLVGEKTALEYLLKYTGDKLGSAKELVEEILENNINMTTLLKKSVDIYNYESGKKKLDLKIMNIQDIIDYSVQKFKTLAEKKSVEIIVEEAEESLYAEVDPKEISKVFDTIIENAIDNSPKSEDIKIKSYKKNNRIIVCVHNKGSGMSPEIREKIFKRYEMAIAIERKIGAGTGLFLAKRIIDAHNGHIWFDTDPKHGTTFYIELLLVVK